MSNNKLHAKDITKYKKELFYGANFIGILYVDADDGYWVYESSMNGDYFNEYSLRLIADFLEELNKPWNKQIEKDLAKYRDDEGDVEW